jgi:cold shock CspA family protein
MEPSGAVRSAIEKKVEKLDRICGCITSCRVVVEEPHRRHHKGRLFHVSIDMTLPGGEIVVNRDHHEKRSHEDVYVAIRDAFDAAQEKVEGYVRRRKGKVKRHEVPAHGKIVRLLMEEDCGFIETPDGQEVYFHRHSILGKDFEELKPGMEVRFFKEEGNKGPQASSVVPIGKHHIVG